MRKKTRIVRSSVVARVRIQIGGDGVRFVNREGRSGQVRVRDERERALLFAMMTILAGTRDVNEGFQTKDARS